jgi:hypothetical protein
MAAKNSKAAYVASLQSLIDENARLQEFEEKYNKLKEKYDGKIEANKRKKEAAASGANSGKKNKKEEESLSDTPATTDSAKKERAPPKCSICKKPKKEGDHSKCATELAKKREAKKKAKEDKKDGDKDESSSSESD